MTPVCSICASVEGPYIQEPTGVPSSPFFYKCRACTQKYPEITFDKTVMRGSAFELVKQYFYICPGCGNMYYKAIPYAFLRFDLRKCPACDHPFPTESDIEFPVSSQAVQIALMGSSISLPPEEITPLFDKLVEILPALSKAIDEIVLVDTPKRREIWAVCKGNHGQVQEALRWVLLKAVNRKLTFSQSQRADVALKDPAIKILRRTRS
jgi:hypothetical protein